MAHGHASVMAKPFTPLSLSPLLWLDASDTTTITSSSGSVSQWNDKSGNGRHATQATSTYQPTTGANTKNGLTIIDFNGTSAFMTTSSFTVPQPATWFVALNAADKNNYYIFDGITTRQAAGRNLVSSSGLDLFAGGVNCVASQTYPVTDAFTFVFNGTSSEIYKKTTNLVTADAGTNQNTGGVRIGSRFSAPTEFPDYLQGAIYELVVYSGALSTSNRTAINDYLVSKWGL